MVKSNRLTRYKTNPYHDQLVITKKNKQVSVSSLGKENNVLVDQTTGEVKGTHLVTYRPVDDAEFIKLFTGNVALAFDLTSAGNKAFCVMTFNLQRSIERDTVYLDEITLEEFLESHPSKKCSMKTLYRGIGELERAKILAKSVRQGVYFINPSFCFNGDRIAFTTILEKKKLSEQQQQLDF